MLPFDNYPGSGREQMGLKKDNGGARRGYGHDLMRRTSQTQCAYCGVDFCESFEKWLLLAVDHVVPKSVCVLLGVRDDWMDDLANQVLACSACNGFGNRYTAPDYAKCPTSFEEFCNLRDRIFIDRKRGILKRLAGDRDFFDKSVATLKQPSASR